jgi:hypothetical protein
MRDRPRTPDHPLIELVYDVFDTLNESTLDTMTSSRRARGHVRDVLGAARHLIDALERLVDELDDPTRPREPRADEPESHDYQTIPLA